MPVVSVGRDRLFEALGKTFTDDEFQHLCFQYGIELDDVVTEQEMLRKEAGGRSEAGDGASDEVLYKIDIPANRYDMLCLEGIARALNVFVGRVQPPQFRLADMAGRQPEVMTVRPETGLVRPFMVCAVLRGLRLDPARYASFIDLQEKLHQNLCRQRSLVSIGTHDLAMLQGPFTYEALAPEQISFVPLKQKRAFGARELLQHYLEHDQKLKKFVPLIQSSIVYPVVLDSRRTVASLPPIINGAHSAITLETRDVLIECTATDLNKGNIVLNTLCAMFSEYCAVPFEVEPVKVPVAQINGTIGVQLSAQQIAQLLSKMQLVAHATHDEDSVVCSVPITRSDVLQACDVVEDVAIAYGYNNLQERVPQTVTTGSELPLNQLVELLRGECAAAGFVEVLTWALCSRAENFKALQRQDDGETAVSIGNPATAEFEVCRTSLLPGMLKTLGANKDAPLPLRLFEASDVVLLDHSWEAGGRNQRRLAAAYSGKESGFEVIHGLLNRIMDVLGVPLRPGKPGLENGTTPGRHAAAGCYFWQEADQSRPEAGTFFPGRRAEIFAQPAQEGAGSAAAQVGMFGVVHPAVLRAFDIPYPVSALELNLEPFCYDQSYRPLTTHLRM